MRLVDADALHKRIKAKNTSNAMMRAMKAECLAEIDDAPTIKPERKKGKWVGAIEYCKHLEETTGERYQPFSLAGMIYCNQCWHASDRRSSYCRECGSYNWEGGDPI